MGDDNKKTKHYGIPTKRFPGMRKTTKRVSGPVSPIRPASEKNEFSKKEKEKEEEE